MATLFLCIALLVPSSGRASPTAADSSDASSKYWIELADRPDSVSRASPSPPPVSPSYLHRLREIGVRPIVQSRWLHAVSATLTSAQHATIRALPFVHRVHPVASGRRAASTTRPLSSFPDSKAAPSPDSLSFGPSRDHLARINAVSPLERGLDGHGVRVGFLDANFRGFRHEAFSALQHDDRMLALRDFTEGLQSGTHGSAVASVAVGRASGTLVGPAHEAQVLGATTEYTQSERNVEEDYFVAGLEWLHRRGADVVNVSIGYTTFDAGQNDYSTEDLDGDTGVTTRAVDRAAQLGMTVVVSAGNSGCAKPDSCWYYINTPADADSAITVGAVGPDSSVMSFSSRGPTADGRTKPDVVVQGEDVIAAWNDSGYARVGGTSFASPQVTGVIAQMLQVNPDLDPIQVRRLLRQTASQANNPDNRLGWGIVDANAAVRAAERRARASPPAELLVEESYTTGDDTQLTIPVRVPTHTSQLHASLHSPLGEEILATDFSVRPGPNRLPMDLSELSSGVYFYRLEGARQIRTGKIMIP